MQKNRQKKINVSMLKWVFVPMIMIFVLVHDISKKDLRQGWSPTGQVQGVQTKKDDYTKYLIQRPIIPEYKWQGEGLVTLWFDDAWLTQYTTAYPMTEKYGYKAAIAVPSNYPGYEDYINWNDLRTLQANGWEITAHSVNHDCSYKLKGTEYVTAEIVRSKEKLVLEGFEVKHYVTPCGVESKEILDITKNNYEGFRKIGYNLNQLPVKDPYNLVVIPADSSNTLTEIYKWLQQTKDKKQWLILMFHQIDNRGHKYGLSPEIFEDILKRITELEIPVLTPSQVIAIKEMSL